MTRILETSNVKSAILLLESSIKTLTNLSKEENYYVEFSFGILYFQLLFLTPLETGDEYFTKATDNFKLEIEESNEGLPNFTDLIRILVLGKKANKLFYYSHRLHYALGIYCYATMNEGKKRQKLSKKAFLMLSKCGPLDYNFCEWNYDVMVTIKCLLSEYIQDETIRRSEALDVAKKMKIILNEEKNM